MRYLPTALALFALCLSLAACGGSSDRPATAGDAARVRSTHAKDRDNDEDHNDDDAQALNYGHAAGPAERRATVALVRRYFADAAATNGARACRLLVPLMAELAVEESGKSPSLRGKTCATVMTKLFERYHAALVEKSAKLQVYAIRVLGDRALALLYFPELSEVRRLLLRRVHGSWRVYSLLDDFIE